MSSVFLLPQNVLPLLHPTVLVGWGKTLRAVIFGVEEALTLEAIIFFKASRQSCHTCSSWDREGEAHTPHFFKAESLC